MKISVQGIMYFIGLILIFWFVSTVTHYKYGDLKTPKFMQKHVSAKTVEKRLDCLALNIYREAGYEPFEGKVAVAQVTLNRTQDPRFPSDVCDVVYQKTFFTEKVVCQFSWYCDSAHRNKPISQKAYLESYEVAKKVLLEGFRLDILNDALYYHADYVSPGWKHERIIKIGAHIFYRKARKLNET